MGTSSKKDVCRHGGTGVCFAALIMMLNSTVADARNERWLFASDPRNPFTGEGLLLAYVENGRGALLGFSCNKDHQIDVTYVPGDRPPSSTRPRDITHLIEYLDIDVDGTTVRLPGFAGLNKVGSFRVLGLGDEVTSVMELIDDRRRTIAIAARDDKRILWSSAFRLEGARAAVKEVVQGCR